MPKPSLDRITFVVSAVFVACLYGYSARSFGWFPDSVLERAAEQAGHMFSPYPFLAPKTFDDGGTRVHAPGEMQPGLTLISSVWRDTNGKPALRLVDRHGTVLHEWRVEPRKIFPGRFPPLSSLVQIDPVHGFSLLEDGHLVVNLPYSGTARLDACSQVLWRQAVGSHHSIDRDVDGSYWIPGKKEDLERDGLGATDQPVMHETINNITEDGHLRTTISVLDVLGANDSLLAQLFRNLSVPDIAHTNDVEVLKPSLAEDYPLFSAGDLVVSLRSLNLVFVFDPETLEAKWHATGPFIQQHDPDFIGDGWIGLFDNNRDGTSRGGRLGGSRIVAIQPHTDSIRILFPRSQADTFYTPYAGNWQLLDNGNLLLIESRAGRILEVTPNGRTVWEWINEPYDSVLVAEVPEASRYDLTPQKVAEWPCSRTSTAQASDGQFQSPR